MIIVKRIYEPPAVEDGYRVLVDRLWPRGISTEHAHLDLWLKEIAPSTELRRWFHHDSASEEEVFDTFSARYEQELDTNPAVDTLRTIVREHPTVTLLVGARDPELNHGKVLEEYLEHHP